VSDDDERQEAGAAHGEAAHSTPHMPPNSLVPVVLALSLALIFVGFLHEVRDVVGPAMWLIGLIALIGSCALWVVTARRDYYELPEEGGH